LKTDTATPVKKGETRPVEANVRFLYGAPGAGLQVEGNARIEPDPNPFPQLKGFDFGRSDEQFREASFDLSPVTTDGAGKAVVLIDPKQAQASDSSHPRRLLAVISAIEPGGRPVRDEVRMPYRPAERYLGVKQNFDDRASPEGKSASFELVAADRA